MPRTDNRFLTRLQSICLSLPEAQEVRTWGHPTFRAGKKTFAVYETYKGVRSLALKTSPAARKFLLQDNRFFPTPYIGSKGWISLKVDGRVDWDEVRSLIVGSYRLVALKRMLQALEKKGLQ